MALALLAVYYPAWHGGLLWDDDRHLTREGLRSVQGLWRIWSDVTATQQYYPVTHSVFWIQHRLWGDDTLGYHIVNLFLHGTSAYLVLIGLRKLAVPGALLAAWIFALHPVHVESIAWITELKNALSGAFVLASFVAYLKFDERRSAGWYATALALFLLALLSKTVTAPLPAAVLVIFWWKRGRINWRSDAMPLLPFFALAVGGGLMTSWLERTMIGAQGSEFAFSLLERCLIAGRVVWFYLAALAWPVDLNFNYPRWSISAGVWWQYLYPLTVAALAAWLWTLRTRAPLAALLLFGGWLFPVLGFLNVYPFKFSFVADHFVYLASIPVIALAAAGLTMLAGRWRLSRTASRSGAIVICAVLGMLTIARSRPYASAQALYLDVLAGNPASWLAHDNLGVLMTPTRPDEALTHLDEAVRLNPNTPEIHNDRGTALQHLGRVDEAIAEYREAVRQLPDFAIAFNNLCNAMLVQSKYEDALAPCHEALRLKPDFLDAHYNLGIALLGLGRPDAAAEFQAALDLRPDFPEAHYYLGTLRQIEGRRDDARAHYEAALRLKPDLADAQYSLGTVLQELGRDAEAIPHYEAAIRLVPGAPLAHNNLGVALTKTGHAAEAVAQFKEALRLKPDYAEAAANLARAQQQDARGR